MRNDLLKENIVDTFDRLNKSINNPIEEIKDVLPTGREIIGLVIDDHMTDHINGRLNNIKRYMNRYNKMIHDYLLCFKEKFLYIT